MNQATGFLGVKRCTRSSITDCGFDLGQPERNNGASGVSDVSS
jgi:hypothetical protein